MGMAASQARLLSITARLTNNENTGQSVSYSKQRLADQTQQITNEYNEALNATKLTVLTGFNGAEANYEDISYNLMTGPQMAENTKQYVVTNTKGKVLVTEAIADAYVASGGNLNRFLAQLGYSQADIYVQAPASGATPSQEQIATAKQIHEAWDKYFETVGITLGDKEHDTFLNEFKWVETFSNNGNTAIGDGYTAYKDENDVWQPINYEGTTEESRNLFDYAMAITESFLRTNNSGAGFTVTYDMDLIKSAAESNNKSMLKYYNNIFNKMQSSGFFTYTDTPAKASANSDYVYSETTKGTGKVNKNPLKDNYTFEAALRDGSLKLEYYSGTEKIFKSTTISEDNCIQEVPDERAIARAESKYNQDMADLENKDKKFDLELKKLDTEHNALQTEYDSVKSVVDKNVESTFKIFS